MCSGLSTLRLVSINDGSSVKTSRRVRSNKACRADARAFLYRTMRGCSGKFMHEEVWVG